MGGALCIVHAVLRTQGDPARFGYIVSKAVGNAVTRNLIRRRLKFISEQAIHDGFSGAEVVFRVLPAAAGASFAELKGEADRALRKIGRFDEARVDASLPGDARPHQGGAHA